MDLTKIVYSTLLWEICHYWNICVLDVRNVMNGTVEFILAFRVFQMCIDPSLSVALGDKPPPLYLCEECSQRIAG